MSRSELHRRLELRYASQRIIEEHQRRRQSLALSPPAPARQPGAAAVDGGWVRHDAGRILDAERGVLTGLAAPFDVIATIEERWRKPYDECLLPGCFAASIRARPKVPITWSHDYKALPLGMSVRLEERADGLYVALRLGGSDPADRVLEMIELGWRPSLSVAFIPISDRKTAASARRADRDLYERTEVDLREISLCVAGAYTAAGIRGRAA